MPPGVSQVMEGFAVTGAARMAKEQRQHRRVAWLFGEAHYAIPIPDHSVHFRLDFGAKAGDTSLCCSAATSAACWKQSAKQLFVERKASNADPTLQEGNMNSTKVIDLTV